MNVASVVGTATWSADEGLDAGLLPAMLRRRTSRLVRMTAEVMARLRHRTEVALDRVPVVHGSIHGELATTTELLAMMHEADGALSPMRFSASVHNTPIGWTSIACANRSPSVTVAAGEATLAAALLEAFGLLTRELEVVVVLADEAIPEILVPGRSQAPAFAAAFHLRAGAEPDLPILGCPRPHEGLAAPTGFRAATIALVAAIEARTAATIALEPGPRPHAVDVRFGP